MTLYLQRTRTVKGVHRTQAIDTGNKREEPT
jgi:hypothetical protein